MAHKMFVLQNIQISAGGFGNDKVLHEKNASKYNSQKPVEPYISGDDSTHKPNSCHNQKPLPPSSQHKDFLYSVVHKKVAPTRLYDENLCICIKKRSLIVKKQKFACST
jgi:hypothetical protein